MNVITRGVRNAFRNQIRTFSIVVILGLSVGLSLAMLIAYQAVGQKINSVKSSVGNTVSISPAGVRGFQGGGSALTASQLAPIKNLPHVTGLTESLNDRLSTANTNVQSAVDAGSLGRRFAQNDGTASAPNPGFGDGAPTDGAPTRSFTPPVTLIGTLSPTELSASNGGGTLTLKSGQLINGTTSDMVALVGTTLAAKNNLTVGSTFTAYGTSVTVAGIFDAGNTFSNNQIIMPLASVQTLSNQVGSVTAATVSVDSISNVDAVTSAVSKSLGSAADVTNAAATAQQTVTPLENIRTISLYSLIGALIAGSVIILLTMIMIVRERRREIGVLKAIGASNTTVMFQFMTEAVTLTMLGALIGLVLGVVAGNPITKLLVTNSTSSQTAGGGGGRSFAARAVRNSVSTIHAAVGWEIILYGLAAALIIALVGSAVASFFIAKVRPAEVMRAE
ncbi:MAG: FtsX-like permease family protein [Candidatus Saccharibacteria bacterium]